MILRPALPDADLVRALERVKDRADERWSAETVLKAIARGDAGAFRFDDGTWVVVEAYGDPRVMNVWVMEGSPGPQSVAGIVKALDELARSIGANSWKWESPRKGWARALRGYYTRTRTVYERDLP